MGTFRYITHPFATRRQAEARAAVRLACVKHAASVQSEPGSNSSVQSLAFAFQGHISATSRSQNTDKVLLPKSLLSSANVCLLLPLNKRPHLSSVSFLKIVSLFTTPQPSIKRFVYQQLRNEIMLFSSLPVKNFFNFLSKAPDSLFTLRLPSALFCQGSVKAPDGRSGAFWDNCLTITYFHTGYSTIIGAISFHGPVRDGKGWFQLAMVIRHNLSVGRHQRPTQSGNQQEF